MKIALGVSGGIACYKAAEIVRRLQDRGIDVTVLMTKGATIHTVHVTRSNRFFQQQAFGISSPPQFDRNPGYAAP